MSNIVIIGMGGIGSHLVKPLCRFINSSEKDKPSIVLIDGDDYEPKNEIRQEFSLLGNKAEVQAEDLQKLYPKLDITGKAWFVTEASAFVAVREGDIVLSCVDNHATRLVLSNRCSSLENVCLISGGNGYDDGSVQIHIRKKGKDITPPITYLHPEIEFPQDKNPGDLGCEELANLGSAPQLIFTNFMASSLMLGTFWRYMEWLKNQKADFGSPLIYFDLKTGNARATDRKPPEPTKPKKK